MLSDRLKTRLAKDRPMTSITLRIPVDVVDAMKEIAPLRGFAGYQTLLKAYLSDGLRRDEAQLAQGSTARLIAALKKRGVPEALLRDAERDAERNSAAA
ncbi:BrnA antitoxin family protein [Janthinobacterium sp. NKUCC08_JDC]|uniref:BrnA antitoxin family protein n=1 Tax=Janthinobacterium sp. NKUCC08_JDC TaxID=2842122 RepID=UPI00214B70B1|nr:BrnA antitoxin family protein [Janthinobacterium sp. NKUCC08_JDC]